MYSFPSSNLLSPPQYRYRPEAIPQNRQERGVILCPGKRPYQTRESTYHAAHECHYPPFPEGLYPTIREVTHRPTPREGHYPIFHEAPYQTARGVSFGPEGSYQTLPEGTYQSVAAEPNQGLHEQASYQLQVPSQRGPQHLLVPQRIQPAPPPQLQTQRLSHSSHQILNDLVHSDDTLTDGISSLGTRC